MEPAAVRVVEPGMEPTAIRSHAASGALHALFLMLAFLTPVTGILDAPPTWLTPGRVARIDIQDVVIETGFRHPDALRQFAETGRGGAPGNGEGDREGARAGLHVTSDPPNPHRELAADPSVGFVEDVGGLLAGFADQTLGPDTETALGSLDDGGGRGGFGGLGIGGMGRGASCVDPWDEEVVVKTVKRGRVAKETKLVHHPGCDGIGLGALGTLGKGMGGGALPAPDLGDKPERRPTVELLADAESCGATPEEVSARCPWRDIVERVIKRHKRELEFCYDRALQRQQRGFDATVAVSFGIAPQGGAAAVELAESSGVAQLDDCVQSRISRWIFPKTGQQIRANYPFRFAAL